MCFLCHKEGQFKENYPDRKQKPNDKDGDSGDAAIAEDGYESADMLLVTTEKSENEWIMDSGFSFHMSPNRHWICDFTKVDGGKVLMGNNVVCQVEGVGSIKIKLENETVKILSDVRFVPELKRNLISLDMLDQLGYNFKAKDEISLLPKV